MMRRLVFVAALLFAPLLGGCALGLAKQSWSHELSADDAAAVADTIAALVVDRVGADRKPVAFAPASTSSDGTLDTSLTGALQTRGLRMATAEDAEAHKLRYLLTTYGDGQLLRVTVDGVELTTILARGPDGTLAAAAPLAVREDR
jgi:hypothetical protein